MVVLPSRFTIQRYPHEAHWDERTDEWVANEEAFDILKDVHDHAKKMAKRDIKTEETSTSSKRRRSNV